MLGRRTAMHRLFLTALALGVLAAACGEDAAPPLGGGLPGGFLVGRTFLSESVTENGVPRSMVEGTQIGLTFQPGGRLSATAGCNHISGSVEVTADRILVGELAMTELGCAPFLHEQDQWLADFLSTGPAYALDEQQLRLDAEGTVIELIDREVADPDRSLEGTVWRLDSIAAGGGPDSAVSSVPGGVEATLVFGEGQVAVRVQGCNQGTADVEVGEATLQVGQLTMTLIGCDGPPAEVEAAIVSVLQGEITYQVEATSLTLTHPSGAGLEFQARD